MIRSKAALLFTIAVFAITGCRGGNARIKEEAPLTHGYRLIDAQQDDEAISYFTSLCQTKQTNECWAGLASAYAHKAGIKIQKFISVMNTAKNVGSLEYKFDTSQPTGEAEAKVDGTLQKTAGFLSKLSGIMSIYASIPEVADKDMVYLDEALKILDSLERPRQVDGLYRAVLRIIAFKHDFATKVIGEGDKSKLGPRCELDVAAISNSIGELSRRLLTAFDDLAIGNPSKAKSYDHVKAQVVKGASDLIDSLTLTTTADQVSLIYFKSLLIESGFGKLLKCKGDSTPP